MMQAPRKLSSVAKSSLNWLRRAGCKRRRRFIKEGVWGHRYVLSAALKHWLRMQLFRERIVVYFLSSFLGGLLNGAETESYPHHADELGQTGAWAANKIAQVCINNHRDWCVLKQYILLKRSNWPPFLKLYKTHEHGFYFFFFFNEQWGLPSWRSRFLLFLYEALRGPAYPWRQMQDEMDGWGLQSRIIDVS